MRARFSSTSAGSGRVTIRTFVARSCTLVPFRSAALAGWAVRFAFAAAGTPLLVPAGHARCLQIVYERCRSCVPAQCPSYWGDVVSLATQLVINSILQPIVAVHAMGNAVILDRLTRPARGRTGLWWARNEAFLLAELCRECRSVEALAPVRNAAGDREHRVDMKIKQPTSPQ